MNKRQFLAALQEQLNGLPQGDIEKSLDYYKEMLEDRIEEGMAEEDAVNAMGPLEEIVAQILMETSLPKLVKAKAKSQRALRIWEIILLILGSPVWAPLLLAVILIVLSLYLVLWSIIVSLYAIDFSFAAAGIGGILGAFFMIFTGFPTQALFFFGTGLVCAGLAVLLFWGFYQITRQILRLSKKIMIWVKSWFIRKGNAR